MDNEFKRFVYNMWQENTKEREYYGGVPYDHEDKYYIDNKDFVDNAWYTAVQKQQAQLSSHNQEGGNFIHMIKEK